MEKPKTTPKDFFLWAGAMIALYVSIFSFIALIFDYINYAFPDPLDYYPSDPYSGGVSYEMASLLVLAPIFLILMRVIHRAIQKDPTRGEVWVRRWALYFTLFIASVTLAIDLIALIMYFFNGDLSLRFVIKVALVFLVAGAGFLHFMADLRGYWEQNPSKARTISWAVGILVVATIASGFLIIGTPMQARLYRFDEQKVSDLQTIQSEVVTYWQETGALPTSLQQLNDPVSGVIVPSDLQPGDSYQYDVLQKLAFKVCATFNEPTASGMITPDEVAMPAPAGPGGTQDLSDSWYHGTGNVCFARTIDPSRYPAIKAAK
jgi:hypothetical protein